MNALLLHLCAFALSLFLAPSAHASQPPLFPVLKVIDGDTIVVNVRGNKETVRLLGIDTPESVDPRKPIQCFSHEATEKMKELVSGETVMLIDDPTQGNRDKYHRLLRYIYLPDAKHTFINGEMIKQGYAVSYRHYRTLQYDKFNRLEDHARENGLGLWSKCP
jgi:micrococcal nuclease